MTQVSTTIFDCGMPNEMPTPLIACNHCGIIALDTPAFGWRRYYDEDGVLSHHCAAAVQINGWIEQGAYPPKLPDEAVEYEDVDKWLSELVGAHSDD